jgi:hypothetical protein
LVGISALTALLLPGVSHAQTPGDTNRPEIVAADSGSGCPSVEGAFVTMFDPARGMLLVSASPFPGGHQTGIANGSAMTVSVPGGAWPLDRIGSRQGQVRLWASRYPFLATSGRGCVGFDKQYWSSEGDLVTYVRWLVEEVYLDLPAEELERRPGFRLEDREIRLRIDRPGYGPFQLAGKEGATLACRYKDSPRTYLLMPFVLDEASSRVAVRIAFTDGKYFDTAQKTQLGWVVASSEQPGNLTDPPLTVTVEGVFADSE